MVLFAHLATTPATGILGKGTLAKKPALEYREQRIRDVPHSPTHKNHTEDSYTTKKLNSVAYIRR